MPTAAPRAVPAPPGHRRISVSTLLILLALAAVTAAIYWPARGFEFLNFDDPQYVTDNPHVRRRLTWPGVTWAFTHAHSSNWHPLTWLSHMLDCQFFALRPAGPHLVNVALHIANTLLLFGWLKRFAAPSWVSALIAGWFALHPTHVESVAWISERKDVLSALFLLLTLWAYGNYTKSKSETRTPNPESNPNSQISGKGRGAAWYATALLLFALGLIAKPMLVTLPLLLLLLDYWPLRRNPQLSTLNSQLLSLIREKIPFFLLSAGSCFATIWAQKESIIPMDAFPIQHRIANALISCWRYLGKLLWPSDLAAFYPFGTPWPLWLAVLAGLGLLLVTLLCLLPKRRPWLALGWLWFIVTLLPVIGLMQVGQQAMADRYTYIPSIGFFLIVGLALNELAQRLPAGLTLAPILGCISLAACGTVTARQLSYWHDSIALFRHAIDVTSDNYAAYNNLGTALEAKGQYDEAIEWFQRALRVRPNSSEAKNNLGSTLSEQGRLAEAEVPLAGAIKFSPGYAQAHYNLGIVYQRQGRAGAAADEFRRALAIKDDLPNAHNNLGCLLMAQGDLKTAEAHFRRVLELRPDDPLALNNLGTTLTDEGRPTEAIEPLMAALTLDPGYADARYNLGNAFLALKQNAQAENAYVDALRLNPRHTLAHYKLGNLFIKAGQEAAAFDHYRAAVSADPSHAESQYQLGYLLAARGETAESIKHYREAVKLRPSWLEALNNLSWALATAPDDSLRNGDEAVNLALKQVELTRTNDCEALDTLAAAYAEAGRFTEAEATARRGIEMARDTGKTNLTADISARLALYQQRKPYRER
jgi:tetratricopeptide (TPR) repeat protein